jgi:hypothetical protein
LIARAVRVSRRTSLVGASSRLIHGTRARAPTDEDVHLFTAADVFAVSLAWSRVPASVAVLR